MLRYVEPMAENSAAPVALGQLMPSQRVLTKAALGTAVYDETASVLGMPIRANVCTVTSEVLPATPER